MDSQLKKLYSKASSQHDDDVVDRFNYSYAVKLFIFFALLVLAKQYVGDPLHCWIPAEFPGTWATFSETLCFIENTYYANGTIPDKKEDRQQAELRYYQWIPFIFALQAFICYAPKALYKFLYSFSDVRFEELLNQAYKKTKSGEDTRDDLTAKFLEQTGRRDKQRPKGWSRGSYLMIIYLVMKVSFLIEIAMNITLLNYFIGTTDVFWGWRILGNLVSGVHWQDNGHFPRVTFCDVTIRDVGQVRTHTIQCVLMMNMFIEKMYIILWVCMFVSFFVSVINLVFWVYRIINKNSLRRLVKDSLKSVNERITNDEADGFIGSYLKKDGVLLLRLLDANVGYVKMADVVVTLYNRYSESKHK
uniref:Innexin n=1 Tax=Steinernema glaseri TaxID=37863 RepID=A0A1I7ZJN2_9BILA